METPRQSRPADQVGRGVRQALLMGWLLGLLVSCAHPPTPEPASSVLRPEEAAARVGREIRVEGEVKGVSRSPRSGVVYLNFGDAYPRQSLSVKIPREHPGVRDRAALAFGRPVRVTGLVEQTNDGPVITARDPAQIEFLPIKPGDALTRIGEGAAYGLRLRAAIEEHLDARNYARLEALAREWRTEKTRMTDGRWLLPVLYGVLIETGKDDESITRRISEIEAWRRARPRAIEPVVVLAGLHVAHGWHARGSGFADTVTAEGWRLFAERLATARTLLDELGPRLAECPHAAAIMQKIALGQGWDGLEYARLYDAAIAREPEYLTYYFQASYRLLPRWHGAPGDWEAYARAAAAGPAGPELLARLPWGLRGLHWNVLDESDLTWAEVRRGFEELMRRYPRSALNRSAYALFAGMAGDRETCLRQLDEAGDTLDMGLWVNWANVDLARRWIADPTARPLVIFRVEGGSREQPMAPQPGQL